MTQLDTIAQQVKDIALSLPGLLGNAAVNWSVDSFRIQGFRSVSNFGTAWQPRQSNLKRNVGRNVLVQSGDLMRSIRILEISSSHVVFGSDLVYAAVHNNGLTIHQNARLSVLHFKAFSQNIQTKVISGRFAKKSRNGKQYYDKEVNIGEHEIKMPRRQIMPVSESDSPIFNKEMADIIIKEYKPLFPN